MALNFPTNPVDGQLYPDPAVEGATQYIYSSSKGTWLTVFRGVARVQALAPIFTTGTTSNPIINISPATTAQSGSLSAADKAKLDAIPVVPGTVSSVTAGDGLGAPATGDTITTTGTVKLLAATSTKIGGVKAGMGVNALLDGTLNLVPPSGGNIGGVKAGPGVTIASDGTISASGAQRYQLLDNISGFFDGTRLNFNMTVGGVAYTPPSINALMIFVGGAIQNPLIGYSITGSLITFTSAPPNGATFYGISLA
jgi:hypothetical protein